jgi:PRTRC genetic system protein C
MGRVFVYDGREFPDPGENLSTEEVKQQMSSFFPELANAEITQSERDSESEPGTKETVYEFKRRVGTKGGH